MAACYRYIEWDENNIWKNEIKHGVTAEEIEQCFNNPPSVIFPHRKMPDRRVLLGRTFGGRYLFIVYQHISDEIARPIHARDMIRNEVQAYEKQSK
ncbi:MAG: BrnT family toxin [Deltaproteobacteria bacterium]|nr:BrnT family toxin [Deltaproteobacteria bacterium]